MYRSVLLVAIFAPVAVVMQCGEDEKACPSPPGSLAPPKCIDEHDWCNAKPHDCPANMDEKNCNAEDCQEDLFHCDSKCIKNDWRCDEIDDCEDETDEKDCTDVDSCAEKLFYCAADRKCIPQEWRCDGLEDCGDGADETGCTAEICNEMDKWFCQEDEKCIPERYRCDGTVDCHKADEDEAQCTAEVCDETDRFFCAVDKKCISEKKRCNYDHDCTDGEDEQNCKAEDCREDYYHCPGSMKCIPDYYVCDGYLDCYDVTLPFDQPNDRSDEEGCTECNYDAFKCPNQDKCIWHLHICDGDPDCEKGEEDYGCSCSDNSKFECHNFQCIDAMNVCDGSCDCSDGSDEDAPGCPGSAQCNAAGKKRTSNVKSQSSDKVLGLALKKNVKARVSTGDNKHQARTQKNYAARENRLRAHTRNANNRREGDRREMARLQLAHPSNSRLRQKTDGKLMKKGDRTKSKLQALLSAIRKNLKK